MIKLLKLTPFFLAVFPVLFLYDHNKNEIISHVIWWPILGTIIFAAIILFGVKFIVKDEHKSIIIASVIIISCLYYGFIYDAIYGFHFLSLNIGRNKYLFPFWVLISLAIILKFFVTKKKLENIAQIVCFSTLIILLIPLSKLIFFNLNRTGTPASSLQFNINDNQKIQIVNNTPDIYYLIPDAYAGSKILSEYFKFDNSEFYKYLEEKGFIIAQNSRSNYSNSYFSVASTLNMGYINELSDILGRDSADYTLVKKLIDDNQVSNHLKSIGYKYFHFDSDSTTFREGGPTTIETPLDSFMRLFMQLTILRPFGGRYGFRESAINDKIRDNILATFDSLYNVSETEGPKFVFTHITSPHGPYIFGRDGEKVDTITNNNLEEMNYYINQLIFVNKKLETIIDNIISKSKSPPIIIIQSDHGFYLPQETVQDTANYEKIRINARMLNFSAYYLPGKSKLILPQDMNAVNTFRFIFDRYFGANYGLLENKSYYYENEKRPYDFVQINSIDDSLPGI